MADPTKFVPGYSYTGYQAIKPTKPLPAPQVDNDFANLQQTTDETIDALKDVRRSDGALTNQIVTLDSLSPEVLAAMATGGRFTGYIFSTRADFVAFVVGREFLPLLRVNADGLCYRYDGVTAALPGLPGWAPAEWVSPSHAGGTDKASVEAAWACWTALCATATSATAAASSALPWIWDAGVTNAGGAAISLATAGYGANILGRGRASRVNNVTITVADSNAVVKGFSMEGGGKVVDAIRFIPRGTNIRRGLTEDVHIQGYLRGLYAPTGDVAWLRFNQVQVEKCSIGHQFDRVIGFSLTDCQFTQNDNQGGLVFRGGEFRANGCRYNANGEAGLRFDGSAATGQSQVVVEDYLLGCSISGNYSGVGGAGLVNRPTWAITAAADNGAGGTRLTINVAAGRHTLSEGLGKCNISGTTSYNGDFYIFNVTDTTFDIGVAYVASEAGTLRRPEWDLEIIGDAGIRPTQVNDIWIADCNINYMILQQVFGVRIDGGRPKTQIFLNTGCYGISRVSNGRGRLNSASDNDESEITGSWSAVPFSGQNYGFVEMISSVSAGFTGPVAMVTRAPISTVPLIGNNVQAYTSISVSEAAGTEMNNVTALTGPGMVGTVSFAGGVNTGAPMETGSTPNGKFIKLADGTMICFSPGLTADVNVPVGSGFKSTPISWTFPAEFISTTNLVVTAGNSANVETHFATGRAVSTTAGEGCMFAFTSQTARGIKLQATGRWRA